MDVNGVCYPYEFTLLSNLVGEYQNCKTVCYPYEFTLLSNLPITSVSCITVCYPYEFTLLSNTVALFDTNEEFVTPMNLHCSQTHMKGMSNYECLLPL